MRREWVADRLECSICFIHHGIALSAFCDWGYLCLFKWNEFFTAGNCSRLLIGWSVSCHVAF